MPHRQFKAGFVIHVLAVVVPESLLIDVAEQMEWLNRDVGSAETPLQQRPEAGGYLNRESGVGAVSGRPSISGERTSL